jgi:hypothetical protein
MDLYHQTKKFLHLDGKRLRYLRRISTAENQTLVAHDDALDTRDSLLKALKLSQQNLMACVEMTRVLNSHTNQQLRLSNRDEAEWLGYHAFKRDDKYARYIPGVGVRSRGRPDSITETDTWIRDMVIDHVNGNYRTPESVYLSLSDSPARMLNIVSKSDWDIAVIDLKTLQTLGQELERTTILAQKLEIPISYDACKGHMKYATPSHILVRSLIPDCCILGFMSKNELEQICANKNISGMTSRLGSRVDVDLLQDIH